MSCDTKLFIQNGINVYELSKYIEKKYGKSIKIIDNMHDCYSIYFKTEEDGDLQRIWIYKYSYKEDITPISIIPKKSCMLSIGYYHGGNSVEILQDIAKNFGGGFLQENDCGHDDGTDEWKYVKGENSNFAANTEINVFNFVENAKDKGNLSTIELTKFILSHLDEIKNI